MHSALLPFCILKATVKVEYARNPLFLIFSRQHVLLRSATCESKGCMP